MINHHHFRRMRMKKEYLDSSCSSLRTYIRVTVGEWVSGWVCCVGASVCVCALLRVLVYMCGVAWVWCCMSVVLHECCVCKCCIVGWVGRVVFSANAQFITCCVDRRRKHHVLGSLALGPLSLLTFNIAGPPYLQLDLSYRNTSLRSRMFRPIYICLWSMNS